ncbi:MAG: ABC transporter permease, partial [Acidimicrobiales bacterium]
MTRYLAQRVAQAIAVIVLVTMIVFGILHFLPGSPARAMLGVRATPGAIAAFNKANGYNRALPMQYLLYLDRLVHGNLGFSYHMDQSVGSLLALDLPKTALLVGVSYALAILIAIPVGLAQALQRNKPLDHSFTAIAFIGYSMPMFWLAMLLIVLFSVQFHLFPAEAPQGASVSAAFGDPQAMILPVATLTIVSVAQFSRFMRTSAIDNLLQDYIRTAKAKGVSKRQLVVRHLLRN